MTGYDSNLPYDDEDGDCMTPEGDHVTDHIKGEENEDETERVIGEVSNVELGLVTVKEEPVDSDYEGACGTAVTGDYISHTIDSLLNTSQASFRSSPSLSNKLPVRKNSTVSKTVKERKTCGRASPLGNTSATVGQTINSVVDLLSVRRELSETCAKLTEAQTQNVDLEVKLGEAHKEIAQLRDSLSTRELQITNLANSFFDLSNQFMRASHEFKRVMQSMQPAGVEYDIKLP